MPLPRVRILDETYITDDLAGRSISSDVTRGVRPQYESPFLIFPENIGQSFLGHWMKIDIYAPQEINFDILQKRFLQGLGQTINFQNTFNSTTDTLERTIILAMPQNNLIFGSRNQYENIALTYFGAKGIAAVAGGILGAALPGIYNVFNAAGQLVNRAATVGGAPINPKLEILFSGREQRQFVFEILMTPSNQFEADMISSIIKELRFHSSPALGAKNFDFTIPVINEGISLPLLQPPSSFHISFYHDGDENAHIPKIKRCVLEEIVVDFSPSGTYSTFTTGHPVQTRMSLGFREIEILTKNDFYDHFINDYRIRNPDY